MGNSGSSAARRLAAEIFRSCLLRMIACRRGCQPKEVQALEGWELLARPEERDFQPRWTRWILAFQQAKEELRNPENLRALLASKASHTPDIACLGDKEGHLCPKCGGQVDYSKREALLGRIEKGFRLRHLRRPLDCEILIGTHLTEEEISQFVGHEVNLSRVERFVRQCYEELAVKAEQGKGKQTSESLNFLA